jgi:hypothetical protein
MNIDDFMTKEQQDSATAAMAFSYGMNQARKLEGQAYIDACKKAGDACRAAGRDPSTVGLN